MGGPNQDGKSRKFQGRDMTSTPWSRNSNGLGGLKQKYPPSWGVWIFYGTTHWYLPAKAWTRISRSEFLIHHAFTQDQKEFKGFLVYSCNNFNRIFVVQISRFDEQCAVTWVHKKRRFKKFSLQVHNCYLFLLKRLSGIKFETSIFHFQKSPGCFDLNNVASFLRLPDFFVTPDPGPKMYNAYGKSFFGFGIVIIFILQEKGHQ